jgi:hypothetical protein
MVSKLLPFGPLLMVSVCGGADLTKCSAAQTSAAHTSTGGPTDWTKASQEIWFTLDGIKPETLSFNPIFGSGTQELLA